MSSTNFSIQEGDSQLENNPVDYSLISPSLMSACFFSPSTILAVPFLVPF